MIEEVTLRQQVERGRRAEAILTNEEFVGAVKRLETRLCEQWRNTKPDDRNGREHAYYLLRALHELQTEFRKEADDARIAEATLVQRARKG